MQVERFMDEEGEHTSAMLLMASPKKSTQVKVETIRRGVKVGRNQPCPCGSGKKYKKCCWLKPSDLEQGESNEV